MKIEGKIIAENRKARHDYFVIETYEAGIELFGTEVKTLRAGNVNLKDSYCDLDGGELFAIGMHISPYEQGNIFNKLKLGRLKSVFHCLLNRSVGITLCRRIALIVKLFTLAKTESHFYSRPFEVE